MPDSNTSSSSASHEKSENNSHQKKQLTGKQSQKKLRAQHKKYGQTRKITTAVPPPATQKKSRVTIKLPILPEEFQEQLLNPVPPPEPETKAEPTIYKRRLSFQKKLGNSLSFFKRTGKRLPTGPSRLILSAILLLFLSSNTILLAYTLTASYVYAYALNPNNGAILYQRNLENQSPDAWLSNPILQQDQIVIGVQRKNSAQQYQLLHFKSRQMDISKEATLNIAQAQPDLSITNRGELISSGAQDLQVRAANGRLLWQTSAHLLLKGAHRFQPVSDTTTVYTIKSTQTGEIAAYNLRDGTELWTQKVADSLEYTPPFVLNQGILYIAGEHTIFALNSSNGQRIWQVPTTARTLLITKLITKNGATRTLLTAGAQGLSALNPDTGEMLWRFFGQDTTILTAPQFYQARLAQDAIRGNMLYASSIRWNIPGIEEQAWLYAVDANTGKQVWSQQLGAGFISGDSSRIFTPLLDPSRQNIIIQHQESGNEQHISAYSMSTGNLRWSTTINGVRQTAPALLQMPDGTLFLFSITNSSITALTTLSVGQYLMLITAFLTLLGLILLWLPAIANSKKYWQITRSNLQNKAYLYLKRLKEQRKNEQSFSPLLWIGLLILLLFSIIPGYYQIFSTNRPGIYQVDAADGSLQWQQINQNNTLIGVDSSGTISSQQEQHLQWLQAASPDGSRWQTMTSEGNIGLATSKTRPDSLLATLTANKNQRYQFATNDPGYPNPLANLLILANFTRKNGHLNWQRTIIQPQEQQLGTILGTDQRYIYISSIPAVTTGAISSKAQLLAVNQYTGNIDWRIFGPGSLPTYGENERLFIRQNQLIWQIQHSIYLLDANSGQIEWQRQLFPKSEDGSQIQQVAITSGGQIVIATQKYIFCIEQNTGNFLWTQAVTGTTTGVQLLTAGEIILIITNSQLQAYTAATQQLLWMQQLHGKLENAITADDGKEIYLSLQSDAPGNTVTVLALTGLWGKMIWRYTVPEQTRQVNLLSAKNNHLLISICEINGRQVCTRKRLSMLATNQGAMLWQTESRAISAIFLNPDASSISFQINK